MESRKVFEVAARMQADGEPYAFVTVVRAVAPTSARPGDKAVVTADGRIFGWIGGGCAQPVVARTVRDALADGRPRQIRITPERDGERELGEVLEFGMACHSGGEIELFIDPVLARPLLAVFGDSPAAIALARLAPQVGFEVIAIAADADAHAFPDVRLLASDAVDAVRQAVPAGAFAVVATQGRRDLQALRAALAIQARQVSFVASRRKAAVLRESLKAGGAPADAVDAIVAPAGHPIAACTPEEIALSVLAALVAARREDGPAVVPAVAKCAEARDAMPAEARDPMPAEARDATPAETQTETDNVATAVRRDLAPAGTPARRSCCGGG